MDISSIFQAVVESKSSDTAVSAVALKIGDRLTGRVLRVDTDGRAVIDLGRFRVRAQIGFPVRAGQALKLQVVQSGATLHLQTDGPAVSKSSLEMPRMDFTQVLSAPDQQKLVKLLDGIVHLPKSHWAKVPFSGRMINALAQVQAVFDAIPMDRPPEKLAQWLKGALENRGVLFEKKMADALVTARQFTDAHTSASVNHVRTLISHDLKPQLLMLKSFMGGEDALTVMSGQIAVEDIEFLHHRVDKLLAHVIQQQERVVQNLRDGDTFQIFTHMLAFEDQRLPVQFKVYYPQKKVREKGDDQQHIALLLQMDHLGPVRVDLAMAGRHLNIRIFVRSEEVQQQFEHNSEAVTQALAGFFDEISLVTRVSDKKIKQFDHHGQDEGPIGRINIRI